MACRDWEPLVALYVEGDLEEVDQHHLQSHLEACRTCRQFAEDLNESQTFLKSIRHDIADDTLLSTVRTRVLAEVEGRECGTWIDRLFFAGRRKVALAGIAWIIAGALWFAHKPEAIVHEPRPVSSAPAPTIMPAAAVYESLPTPVQSKPISKPSVQRRHKPTPAPAATRQQVTIKLLTDDPNVIIYWLVDEKGD